MLKKKIHQLRKFIKKLFIKFVKKGFFLSKNKIRYFKRSYKYLIQIAEILDKELAITFPESDHIQRQSAEELYKQLLDYDVISFDIFDTLLFRSWSSPKDIFEMVGLHLNIQNFKGIRKSSEAEARKAVQFPIHEVTIGEIYDLVALKCGIDKQLGIDLEFSMEKKYCFANPYMKQIFDQLISNGKTVIATSDMYFSKEQILELLNSCGYSGFAEVFISSEYDCTKVDGRLQKIVQQKMGIHKSYIHIGDNKKSDILASSKVGWKTVYYQNVNELGKEYRPSMMTSLGGGLYRGIVNQRLYSGIPIHDPYYEFGYVYMGLLICGYCEWLNHIAHITNSSKILFASRDMYIVEKVYDKFFNKFDHEYIQISRMTALKMDFEHESEMMLWYIKKNISLSPSQTIAEALKKVELGFLVEMIDESELKTDEILTTKNVSKVFSTIYQRKSDIIDHFKEEREIAKEYFASCTETAKNVLFADTNGRCTSIYALQHLMESSDSSVNIIGALMYSVSDPGYVDAQICKGSLFSYICSLSSNQNIYSTYRLLGEKSTQIIEAVFTSDKGTLKAYQKDSTGNIGMDYYPEDSSSWQQRAAIHTGILDFAQMYNRFNGGDNAEFTISSTDAWIPLGDVIFDDRFINKYFEGLKTSLKLGG